MADHVIDPTQITLFSVTKTTAYTDGHKELTRYSMQRPGITRSGPDWELTQIRDEQAEQSPLRRGKDTPPDGKQTYFETYLSTTPKGDQQSFTTGSFSSVRKEIDVMFNQALS